MKKIVSRLLVLVMSLTALFSIGCGDNGNGSESGGNTPPSNEQDGGNQGDNEGNGGNNDNGGGNGGEVQMGYKYVSLLKDRKFEDGFYIRGLNTAIYHGTRYDGLNGETIDDSIETVMDTFGKTDPYPTRYFQYNEGTGNCTADEADADPSWNLCQWSTRYPWHDVTNTYDSFNYRFTDKGNNEYLYENRSKALGVNTATGDFRLALKASECYHAGVPRADGQEWPHLLLEQEIGSAGEPTKQMSVKNMRSLKVSIDYTLNSFSDHMNGQADPAKHASICMFYLFVSYKAQGATGFSDMIWLGMTLFDNRTPLCTDYGFIDEGSKDTATGKYIYNIGSQSYLSNENNVWENGSIKVNKEAKVDFNVLPKIEQALTSAQASGLMKGATMDDLYINGMYIGYENTGTYDIDMTFKNMNVASEIYTRL